MMSMFFCRLRYFQILLLTVIGYHSTAHAATTLQEPVILKLDLQQAIALAQKNNPITELSRLEVEIAREKSNEVSGKFFSPRINLESYSGLISGAKETITGSWDEDNGDLGPFFKVDLKIIQPLYTFGKYTNATEASRLNVQVQKAALQETVNQLTFSVTKAYLGLIAGQDSHEVAKKLDKFYQKLLKQINLELERGNPDINDSHLLEARAMFFEIEKQASRGTQTQEQAKLLLKGLINLDPNTRVVTTPLQIPDFETTDSHLQEFLDYAHDHSWLLKKIDAGVKALQQRSELATNMKLPDFFLAAGAGLARAPNRERLPNSYLDDDYNYERIGAVFGLKWNFNYQTRTAKEQQAVIDYLKLKEKRKLAILRLDGEIRDTYMVTRQQWRLLAAAGQSLKSAKQWIRLENDNFDMGIGDIKRLISAYRKYFHLQGDEIESRYNYLEALARLARKLGSAELYLQWETHGHVQIY